ncbi:MAG: hypothetical protein IKA04_00335 [Alistipes sp.]|nr:hypothetical protein [Alistipes sp.]
MKLEKKDISSISEKLLEQMNKMDENELTKMIRESVVKQKGNNKEDMNKYE